MTHPLLELQGAITMGDQLRHRRQNLAERDHVVAAKNALIRWNDQRLQLRKTLDELAATIERTETEAAANDAKRARLDQQLRTIIAPREAEALQHEIATLEQQRSDLDDVELEAMEEQARLEGELATLLTEEESLRNAYLSAESVAAEREHEIDRELNQIDNRLEELRSRVNAKALKRFDRIREHQPVAAAALTGSRCQGCHLDLSAAEVDQVKDAGDDGVSECPQCGRLLVL